MNTALKRTHGSGYLFLLGFVLVIGTFINTGCSMFEKDYKAEDGMVLPDGTEVKQGEFVYLDANSKATANAVDPVTGEPNKKLRVPDVEKLEKAKEQGEKVASGLPAPFSSILLAILGIGGAGGIATARVLRNKKLADAGVPVKKKT